MFLLGIFANFFASEKLIVPGNAADTAKNLMEHMMLFRLGIAAWLVMIVLDLIVAWALYLFLIPIDKGVSLLAAAGRNTCPHSYWPGIRPRYPAPPVTFRLGCAS